LNLGSDKHHALREGYTRCRDPAAFFRLPTREAVSTPPPRLFFTDRLFFPRQAVLRRYWMGLAHCPGRTRVRGRVRAQRRVVQDYALLTYPPSLNSPLTRVPLCQRLAPHPASIHASSSPARLLAFSPCEFFPLPPPTWVVIARESYPNWTLAAHTGKRKGR